MCLCIARERGRINVVEGSRLHRFLVMNKYGRFGALLGTIYVGHTNCKFLVSIRQQWEDDFFNYIKNNFLTNSPIKVYAARNAEVLTCHELPVKEINAQNGWSEVDPLEIWQNVVECIQTAVQNLEILDINPDDIVAIGLTNQRDTSVMWHKESGRPLYNAIGTENFFFVFILLFG